MMFDTPRATDIICNMIRTLRNDGADSDDIDGLCFHEYIPNLDSTEHESHEKYLSYPIAQHISYKFTRKKIFDKWHKLYKRSFEMFLIQYEAVYKPIVTPDIVDCVPKKLPVTHSPDPAAFQLIYYRKVLLALIVVFSLAVIALIVEHICLEWFPMNPVNYIRVRLRRNEKRGKFRKRARALETVCAKVSKRTFREPVKEGHWLPCQVTRFEIQTKRLD